ncbi:HU family DNA-binding protein, partial [Clostridioides difficile]
MISFNPFPALKTGALEAALNAFMSSVQDALVNNEKVQLVGFGTFETRERAARQGRNP